ncbi:hypothetical protein [uncultured Tateyamaria sp.]|uniref:hypothetical protein n=1 Tax=uncultured Tateyamaria sp. TaxID=455651 RepID=UPI0026321528|nr:hypothetical protein [uncultured Tateyamaria sp.]
MSDYPNPNAPNHNLHRGDGVSGRGVLIALLVLLAVIVLIAIVGSIGGAGDGTAPTSDVISPAVETPLLPAE